MGLRLIAGPANAGKVGLLLDRYLAAIEREPVLIVPNRSDVDPVERELLARCGCLLGGTIGTFDDVFERLAPGSVLSEPQRTLLVRRLVEDERLARFAGFADALRNAVVELEQGLVDPSRLDGDLGRLYARYADELQRLGVRDRELRRRDAVERLLTDFDAWRGEPVFAYGFEDLTGAEWELLRALAGRTDVTVSLPYEPGRTAFASLQRTANDLAALADGAVEELQPHALQPALAHLERTLFVDVKPPPRSLEGAVRFFEGAGARGALELVGEELLALIRTGTEPERIGLICPSVDRVRAPLETVLGTLGIPYAVDGPTRLGRTPFGHALLALVRFAWLGGTRRDLFAFLRSPYSGIPRHGVDFLEGRLRGRAIHTPDRVVEEAEKLRGSELPALGPLQANEDPVDAVRALAASMLRAAYGLDSPPATEASAQDLRVAESIRRLAKELERWRDLAGELTREDVAAALERLELQLAREHAGRVAVVDLMRARTRRFDVAFVLGLEEGSLPRRGRPSPFLDDDERRRLGARLEKADPVSRDRYLFYTACTRASKRLYLVREAATDDGVPREASPFWDEARACFDADDVARWTTQRPLSALAWPLEQAPTERERLRALAELAARDSSGADAVARANGWQRRLERALRAWSRPTRLVHPSVREQLASRTVFNVTELERFADCSSAWFVERLLDPRSIDAEVDAKLKGMVAHTALSRFFSGLPKELGVERIEPTLVEDCVRFMRACLDSALAGLRMEMTDMQRRELDQTLWRDLEALVREEAEADRPLVPRRFEVSFGTERAPQELQRGLDLDGLTLSGKIDRIDVDPHSARGIVQDYKSGKHAFSANEIEKELRLQIPLYMLVLRDLVGIEPLGGVYRPLSGERKARGLLRADARAEVLAGYSKNDYLDEDEFWSRVEGAKALATQLAGRIREGDVRHDPKGGECPTWCDLWPICRVGRA